MTKTKAYILSAILIATSFAYGCFNAVSTRDTDTILIESGINPVNGANLGK